MATDDAEANDLLSLLLNALYALGTLHRPQVLVKAAFEMRLMALIGFAPLFDGCCACGAVEPAEPVFDLQDGLLLCRACAVENRAVPLTSGALQAIRHAVYSDPKRLYSFSLREEDQMCFSRVTEAYLRTTLDRNFHTLDFYKRLRNLTAGQNTITNSIKNSD